MEEVKESRKSNCGRCFFFFFFLQYNIHRFNKIVIKSALADTKSPLQAAATATL